MQAPRVGGLEGVHCRGWGVHCSASPEGGESTVVQASRGGGLEAEGGESTVVQVSEGGRGQIRESTMV